jgi:hypothetical protein
MQLTLAHLGATSVFPYTTLTVIVSAWRAEEVLIGSRKELEVRSRQLEHIPSRTLATDPSIGVTGYLILKGYSVPATFKLVTPSLMGESVIVTKSERCGQTWIRFAATAGHRITALATNPSPSNFDYAMQFFSGDSTAGFNGGAPCVGMGIAPTTGPYQLLFRDGYTATAGSVTVTLYDVVDGAGSTTINPTTQEGAVQLAIRAPDERPTVQFTTLPNSTTVSVVESHWTLPGCPQATLFNAADHTIVPNAVGCGFGPVPVLASTTYLVEIRDFSCATGSADLTITTNN